MVDENVPAPAPTRSDDQILPFAAWVAFTASALVPAIYIQQFWNTLTYEAKTGAYSFQLDETRFVLDANLLRDALEITPIVQAHQFVSPLSGDAIMDFVNELGYLEVIHFVSRMAVNNLYQPWRAILSMINQCLTGKTSGHDRPRYPVLQILWGIITSLNVDFAELTWEEFVQDIQTFLTNKANLGSPTKKGRKDKPHVIPSTSLFHLAGEDLRLSNLKFVPKGEEDKKVATEKEEKKKSASTKQTKPKPAIKNSNKPAPAPKPKVTKENPSIASTAKPPKLKPAKEKSTKATPLQKASKDQPPEPDPKPEPEQHGEVKNMMSSEHSEETGIKSGRGSPHAHVGGDPLSSTGTLSSIKESGLMHLLLGISSLKDKKLNMKAEELNNLRHSEQKNKNTDNITRNLGSRVFTLELRGLPHKINETSHENVKEAVQIALQDPLRDRFRDLSKEDMKEMLHQRMFDSGTYKSLPE
ncbi:hypothetical protein Tco_1301961 [Tanacetum coccineum]